MRQSDYFPYRIIENRFYSLFTIHSIANEILRKTKLKQYDMHVSNFLSHQLFIIKTCIIMHTHDY
jgi:hypothetical protein